MDVGLGLEGRALDLRGPLWWRAAPPWDFPEHRRLQGAGAEQEFPVRGDSTGAALRCVPRLRARHLRRARAERNWEVEDSLA